MIYVGPGPCRIWWPPGAEGTGWLGQSNRPGASTDVQSAAPNIAIHRAGVGGVTTAPSPLPQPATYSATQTTYGSLPAYAAARGMPQVMLLNAVGGTRLVVDAAADALDGSVARWDPTAGRALAEGTWYTGAAGDLYRSTLSLWQYLGRPRLRFWSWLQGESEWSIGNTLGRTYEETYALYYAAMSALVSALWEDTGIPTMITPISLCYDYTGDTTGIAAALPVHDAQIAVAADHPHAYLGADTDDLTLMHTQGDPGNLHIYDVATLGTRESAASDAAGL